RRSMPLESSQISFPAGPNWPCIGPTPIDAISRRVYSLNARSFSRMASSTGRLSIEKPWTNGALSGGELEGGELEGGALYALPGRAFVAARKAMNLFSPTPTRAQNAGG